MSEQQSSSTIKNILYHIISNNQSLAEQGKKKNALLIEGPAGLGKTSVVQQVAESVGFNFVKVNLSNVEQAGDLCGFPIREFEYTDSDLRPHWINEVDAASPGALDGLKRTGKTRTGYCKPDWVPEEDGNGTILLLDDFTRGATHIMQATMEVIDRGEYLSWKLPKNCHVILTSNPSDGDYNVSALDDAQSSRYIKVEMGFNLDEWARWAEGYGLDSRCINFILLNPEMVTQKTNPRLITDFFNSISSLKDFSAPESLSLIRSIGAGSVGREFSTTFCLFIQNRLDKIPSPGEIYSSAPETSVQKISDICGSSRSVEFRQDIAGLMGRRLVNFAANVLCKTRHSREKEAEVIAALINNNCLGKDVSGYVKKELNGFYQFKTLVSKIEN